NGEDKIEDAGPPPGRAYRHGKRDDGGLPLLVRIDRLHFEAVVSRGHGGIMQPVCCSFIPSRLQPDETVSKELGSLAFVVERCEFNIERSIAPTPNVLIAGQIEGAITQGRRLQHDVQRVLREEVFGVKEMDGPAVDADPYGAVG